MTDATGAFRQALNDGDVYRVNSLFGAVFPHLPQMTAKEAEIVMHRARTETETISLPKRLYSHAWLEERQFASALPDELRPDPLLPRDVRAVGISVRTLSRIPEMKERAQFIQSALTNAAGEAMEDGETDVVVKKRIMDARLIALKRA